LEAASVELYETFVTWCLSGWTIPLSLSSDGQIWQKSWWCVKVAKLGP